MRGSLTHTHPLLSTCTHTQRIKTIEAGGQVRSAYGWVLVDSPNGLTHQVRPYPNTQAARAR